MNGISVSTCFNYEISLRDQLEHIHKAGFTHFSIGSDYSHSGILEQRNYALICALAEDNNLSIDTIHGCALDRSDTVEVNQCF